MSQPNPLPITSDYDTGGFFEAASRGELAIRACRGCGRFLHLPKAYCDTCGSWDTLWQVVEPSGRLYSWTVVTQQMHPSFDTPYTIVLVELDDAPGVRLIGRIRGEQDLEVNMPMRAVFEALNDDVAIPQWLPKD